MLSDDEKEEKHTMAVEQAEKADSSLESHLHESARQPQESEQETEATSGDKDIGGRAEEDDAEIDGEGSPDRSAKWRRPSRLSLLSATSSLEPEPEPEHWPQVKAHRL
jgi:hypothetical protein